MLGYLQLNVSVALISLKLLLHKTLARTKLEYAAAVYDPGLIKIILFLEQVQSRSVRFILSDYHSTSSVSCEGVKATLSLSNLLLCLRIVRLCLLYKIYDTPVLKERFLTPPSTFRHDKIMPIMLAFHDLTLTHSLCHSCL